jgi:hydrogenase maturation protease
MKDTSNKLLIGIGNVGRNDDGLAWKFLDRVKGTMPKEWECVYRYQLNIEDADLLSNYDTVVIVDAYNEKLPRGYAMEECHANVGFEYTTHALSPCTVLALCNKLYEIKPLTFVVKIQGYDWDLKEGLSDQASINLVKAVSYFERKFLSIQV